VEIALQKIDGQICSLVGNYSTYQFNCLPAWFGQSITTEAQFVDAITGYACEITNTLQTFTGVTFPAFKSDVMSQIDNVITPTITCSSAGVTSLDSLQTILTKYCTKFGQIDTALSIAGVNWGECLTVVSTPTTIAQAFSLVVDQICQVKALTSGALPTFNNLGTCLASPGSADSLVSTIGKIITRVCLSPTYNAANITWGCVSTPSSATSIEAALQNIITGVNTSLYSLPTFSGDFVVTANNVSNPCAGVHVALATPLNQDRFVASNASDSSPGTLQSKTTAGTNITLDFVSTPGQMIINSTAAVLDHKVLASTGDTTPGFLDQKIAGSTNSGVTLSPIYDAIAKKLDLNLSVDLGTLLDLLLDELVPASDLYNKFCAKVALCPCNCGTTDCTTYLVEADGVMPSGGYLLSYVDCVSGTTITFRLLAGASISVCSKTGAISGSGLTITATGSCSGGTTSTTTSSTTAAP
jgi:hypothetical protein